MNDVYTYTVRWRESRTDWREETFESSIPPKRAFHSLACTIHGMHTARGRKRMLKEYRRKAAILA